jgi:DNA-binding response OmpR family regulator
VRILLVEDEKKVAKALQEAFYSIRVAHTGEDGFYLISSEPFDLIILDVMLSGRSGIEIVSTARSHGLRTPVLILTARTRGRTASTVGRMIISSNHSRFPSCKHAFAWCSGEERTNR